MDWLAWLTSTLPAGAIVNGLGLGALAILFASDRIMTRGQHARRVGDIERAHDLLHDERAARIADVTASRDYWREAQRLERDRADAALEQLAEVADVAKLTARVIESLNDAAKGTT